MSQLKPKELTGLVLTDLTGKTVRSPGPVGKTAYTLGKKAILPLVTRLGADAILMAKYDKGQLALKGSQGKFASKTHDIGLLPGHDKAPFLSPIFPKSVTHVLNLFRYPCLEPVPREGKSEEAKKLRSIEGRRQEPVGREE